MSRAYTHIFSLPPPVPAQWTHVWSTPLWIPPATCLSSSLVLLLFFRWCAGAGWTRHAHHLRGGREQLPPWRPPGTPERTSRHATIKVREVDAGRWSVLAMWMCVRFEGFVKRFQRRLHLLSFCRLRLKQSRIWKVFLTVFLSVLSSRHAPAPQKESNEGPDCKKGRAPARYPLLASLSFSIFY